MSNGVTVAEGVSAVPPKTVAEINQQINDFFNTTGIAYINNAVNSAVNPIQISVSDLQTQMANLVPNSAAAQAISVGASPFTYTNATLHAGLVIISGGTVTTIQIIRNGVSYLVGLLGGAFQLSPGDGIRVAYILAPTMTFIPF